MGPNASPAPSSSSTTTECLHVCVRVPMCVCMHVGMYVCGCICKWITDTRTDTRAHVHTSTGTQVHADTHRRVAPRLGAGRTSRRLCPEPSHTVLHVHLDKCYLPAGRHDVLVQDHHTRVGGIIRRQIRERVPHHTIYWYPRLYVYIRVYVHTYVHVHMYQCKNDVMKKERCNSDDMVGERSNQKIQP